MGSLDPLQEAFPDDGPVQVFEVDTSLSPLQAVQEWAAEGNPPGQRVAYIQSIPQAAAQCSLEEARVLLLPLLAQLIFDDHPDVKHAAAEVLGPLGPILAAKDPHAQEAGGSEDAFELLVLAHRLLQDPERAIQEAAATSVAQFAGLLFAGHRREHLTAVVDELMRNYDDEQMQECAVDLLAKVASVAGAADPEWCRECALPRVLKLSMHRDYNIRVHSVVGLVQLAGCLPEDDRCGELLSAFADLSADQVWSVRQDCASELAALAQQLPRAVVRDRLLPLWEALAGDVSAWVKAAARRQAGPLLASVHREDVTGALLECFVSAAAGPATLTEACAHFMPAVLANVGADCWPQLREAVVAMAASEYLSVRVMLAERMHEMVALVGPQRVEQDLLPVVEKLSADEHQAVADALAVNIRELLAGLPRHARLAQLGFLARMHPEDGSSCGQWRMRLLIAEQLAGIAALLEKQGLAEVLLPATLRLCEDPVAAVREAAAAQLGGMVGSLLAGGDQAAAAVEPAPPQLDAGAAAEAAAEAAPPPAAAEQGAEQGEAQAQTQDAEQAQEQEQEQGQDEADADLAQAAAQRPGGSAAVVQQIVQHLVELERSRSHRSRQAYLVFCGALLLPQPQHGRAAPAEVPADADTEAGAAAAAAWPPLPEAVAQSGIAQALLEAAVALATDPVPNVRLSVARLLAALQQQQPQVAAATPQLAAALAALAADPDPDVQSVAAGGR